MCFSAAAPSGSDARVLDGLNHLFQRSKTGEMEAYDSDGPPMREPVAGLIAEWCSAR